MLQPFGVGTNAFVGGQVAVQVDKAVGFLGETVIDELVHAVADRGAMEAGYRDQVRDVDGVERVEGARSRAPDVPWA
ncbi:hypothetical protein J116_027940 [Streptomyces thermolilacinus SPC6]|uniref:Uncharacterized protein n=1 Tax=Streptomyces thermolilacinus SPC6 TaxID=1306406 RepID=A0A1D3DZF6_9ACTN|nr:hypothetical protein J116_027940 [Streptomyces thermolilacinus SPC6]